MKKHFASLLRFHPHTCTLWMFTCQSTPKTTPHTPVRKTHTTPINRPHHSRGRLPPNAQRRAPGSCPSDGPSHSMRSGTAVVRARRPMSPGTRKEGRKCCEAELLINEGESAERYSQDNDSDISCPHLWYENDTYTISALFMQLLAGLTCVFIRMTNMILILIRIFLY